MSDPIGDMITRIRNSYLVGHQEVSLPYSKVKENIAQILLKKGFLKKVAVEGKKLKMLVLTLKYKGKEPTLTHIERISRPGRRIYVGAKKIQSVLSGLGINIFSTSAGIMTGREAKQKKLGGEIICRVW